MTTDFIANQKSSGISLKITFPLSEMRTSHLSFFFFSNFYTASSFYFQSELMATHLYTRCKQPDHSHLVPHRWLHQHSTLLPVTVLPKVSPPSSPSPVTYFASTINSPLLTKFFTSPGSFPSYMPTIVLNWDGFLQGHQQRQLNQKHWLPSSWTSELSKLST